MHYKDVIAQKVYKKCAKLVDEKNKRSVRDSEPKILIKGLTLFKNNVR